MQLSESELEKCLDYLGLEMDSALMSHLTDSIVSLMGKYQLLSTEPSRVAQLKNFLPSLSTFLTENDFSLDNENTDVMAMLTNQNLTSETLWRVQGFARPDIESFISNSVNEVQARSVIMSSGSLLCNQNPESLVANFFKPSLVGDFALVMKNCAPETIRRVSEFLKFSENPSFNLSFIVEVRDLGVFAFGLLLDVRLANQLTASVVHQISLDALEILPREQISRISRNVWQLFSLKQSQFLLTYRELFLHDFQRKLLTRTVNRFDAQYELKDFLDLKFLPKIDTGGPDLDNSRDLSASNISFFNDRHSHIVYIFSHSSKLVSQLSVTVVLVLNFLL